MKQKRRSVKWLGVTACAFLLFTGIGTSWSALGYQANTLAVNLSVGCFEISVFPKSSPKHGWFAVWQPYETYWLPKIIHGRFNAARTTHLFLPLWIPLLIVGAATILAFKHDRQFGPDHCQTCGYDLHGAEHEKCPECGNEYTTPI